MNLFLADVLVILILVAVVLGISLARDIASDRVDAPAEDLTSGDYYDITAARANPVLAPAEDEDCPIGRDISERVELSRRFWEIASNNADLSSLPQRLEGLYLIEVDR